MRYSHRVVVGKLTSLAHSTLETAGGRLVEEVAEVPHDRFLLGRERKVAVGFPVACRRRAVIGRVAEVDDLVLRLRLEPLLGLLEALGYVVVHLLPL